jgi:hypothetical protein
VGAAHNGAGLSYEEAHEELLSAADRLPIAAAADTAEAAAPVPDDAPTAPFNFDTLVAALGAPAAPPLVEAVASGETPAVYTLPPDELPVGGDPFAALEAELRAQAGVDVSPDAVHTAALDAAAGLTEPEWSLPAPAAPGQDVDGGDASSELERDLRDVASAGPAVGHDGSAETSAAPDTTAADVPAGDEPPGEDPLSGFAPWLSADTPPTVEAPATEAAAAAVESVPLVTRPWEPAVPPTVVAEPLPDDVAAPLAAAEGEPPVFTPPIDHAQDGVPTDAAPAAAAAGEPEAAADAPVAPELSLAGVEVVADAEAFHQALAQMVDDAVAPADASPAAEAPESAPPAGDDVLGELEDWLHTLQDRSTQ